MDALEVEVEPHVFPARSPHPMPLQNHDQGACRRSCCWTPFGHSATVLMCACHGSIGEWAEYLERAR